MELINASLKALMLAYVVLRGGGNWREKKQPWTGDYYTVTYLYPGSKPGSTSSGSKR